jgi:hypothetical protein
MHTSSAWLSADTRSDRSGSCGPQHPVLSHQPALCNTHNSPSPDPQCSAHLTEPCRALCAFRKVRLVAHYCQVFTAIARPAHAKALKGRELRLVESGRCVALAVAGVRACGQHQCVVTVCGCVRAPVAQRILTCCQVALH